MARQDYTLFDSFQDKGYWWLRNRLATSVALRCFRSRRCCSGLMGMSQNVASGDSVSQNVASKKGRLCIAFA